MWEAASILALGSLFTWLAVGNIRRRIRAWQDLAVSCGLEVTEVSLGWRPRIVAGDGLGIVWIEPYGVGGLATRMMVESPGPPDLHQVMIRPLAEAHEWREIKVGD